MKGPEPGSFRARLVAFAAAVAVWACAACPGSAQAGRALAEALRKVPADNRAAAVEVFEGILAGGPRAVYELAGLIAEPGERDDAKARYALHGLAVYVSRPKGAPQRPTFVAGVAGRLRVCRSVRVKAFLIRQLQVTAGPESVRALANYLLDEDLCACAAHALMMIADEPSLAAMRDALAKAKGRPRLTLIQALGVLRDARSAAALLSAARDANRDVRTVAWFALANIGHSPAAPLLTRAATEGTAYERAKALDACLLLAHRLGQTGRKQPAAAILRGLWKQASAEADRHVRCAVLGGLASTLGADAIDEILAALKSEDPQIHAAALAAAKRVKEKKQVISAAADQACEAALELVLPHLADPALRAEAAAAAVKIAWALQDTCPDKAAAAAKKILAAAKDANVRKKAQELLDRIAKR